MAIKNTPTKETSNLIKFFYNAIQDKSTDKYAFDPMYNKVFEESNNYNMAQQWLNYTKFAMLFLRDAKISFIDNDDLKNALFGEFPHYEVKEKGDHKTLEELNLTYNEVAILREYLIRKKQGKSVNSKKFDVVNKFIKEKDGKIVSTFDDVTINLDENDKLRFINDALGYFNWNVTYDGEKVEVFKTSEPISLVNNYSSTVKLGDNPMFFVHLIRHAIAHKNLTFDDKIKKYAIKTEGNREEVHIPKGWLMCFGELFYSDQFANLHGDRLNTTGSWVPNLDNEKLKHFDFNNEFVMITYPPVTDFKNLDDVINFLNNRTFYVLKINEPMKFAEAERIVKLVNQKLQTQSNIQKFEFNNMYNFACKRLKELNVNDFTLEIKRDKLTEKQEKYWRKKIADCPKFLEKSLVEEDKVVSTVDYIRVNKEYEKALAELRVVDVKFEKEMKSIAKKCWNLSESEREKYITDEMVELAKTRAELKLKVEHLADVRNAILSNQGNSKEIEKLWREQKVQILKDIENYHNNNIEGYASYNVGYLSNSIIQLMHGLIDNSLMEDDNGKANKDKFQITFETLIELGYNKAEYAALLATYSVYNALIESGYYEKVCMFEEGKKHLTGIAKEDYKKLQEIDMQSFEFNRTSNGKTTQTFAGDSVENKRLIMHYLRTAICHGNVEVVDFYDYPDNIGNIKLKFYNDNYIKKSTSNGVVIYADVDDVIKTFSNDMFFDKVFSIKNYSQERKEYDDIKKQYSNNTKNNNKNRM